MSVYQNIKAEVQKLANKQKAEIALKFFKTGKGQYAEGDKFIGLTVPDVRKIAGQFSSLDTESLKLLISSEFNEERLLALFILQHQYISDKRNIYQFYLDNLRYINNWNLVDASAESIMGAQVYANEDHSILLKLAKSNVLWERRIAIIATFYFIKNNLFSHTIEISILLLKDSHDLIHKAVGWMLREVGKRNHIILQEFLDLYSTQMPRTMLRYAIEKMPEKQRMGYLKR